MQGCKVVKVHIEGLSSWASQPSFSLNTSLLSHQSPFIQINLLIDGAKGFYFLKKHILKST